MIRFGLNLFLSLGFTYLILALSLPYSLNFDQVREQIKKELSVIFDSDVQLGAFELNLLGKPRIRVRQGLWIKDHADQHLLEVPDLYFEPNFETLWTKGHLSFDIVLDHAQIQWAFLKNLRQKLQELDFRVAPNLKALSFFEDWDINLDLRSSAMYFDQGELRDLKAVISYLKSEQSLNMRVSSGMFWSSEFQAVGEWTGALKIMRSGALSSESGLSLEVNLSGEDLHLEKKDIYKKAIGVPLNLEAWINVTDRDIEIQKFAINLKPLKIEGKGTLSALMTDSHAHPLLDLEFKTNEFELGEWLGPYFEAKNQSKSWLRGLVEVTARISGEWSNLVLKGKAQSKQTWIKLFADENEVETKWNLSFRSGSIDDFWALINRGDQSIQAKGFAQKQNQKWTGQFWLSGSKIQSDLWLGKVSNMDQIARMTVVDLFDSLDISLDAEEILVLNERNRLRYEQVKALTHFEKDRWKIESQSFLVSEQGEKDFFKYVDQSRLAHFDQIKSTQSKSTLKGKE